MAEDVTLNLSLAATGPVDLETAKKIRRRAAKLAEDLQALGVTTHFSCGPADEDETPPDAGGGLGGEHGGAAS